MSVAESLPFDPASLDGGAGQCRADPTLPHSTSQDMVPTGRRVGGAGQRRPDALFAHLVTWVRHHVPTPESVGRSRVLRPVAHRLLAPALWRFNRRSVPRGVALGMGTGILLPFAHMPLAAALALPCRANIPAAVMMTLISNPLTIVEIVWLEHRVGRFVLRLDAAVPGQPVREVADAGWLHWLMSSAGVAAVGALVLAPFVAAAGYGAAAVGWRWWTARRWRRRHRRAAD